MSTGAELGAAIVGCGQIGHKRARSIVDSPDCRLVACSDAVSERAVALAASFPGVEPVAEWQVLVGRPDVDLVVVATPHDALASIARAAALAGKHVLVEKPGARRAAELDAVVEASQHARVQVRVGFNHRLHPAMRKARAIYEQGGLGELMFIRGRYGHGGRVGYEREWRARPDLSGGGELIDQGIHLIDLSRWYLGEFVEVQGCAPTLYWDMPVDDNAFLLLKTDAGRVAFLHASCTEWKNLFSFEIYGRRGKIDVNGLGGSYGIERVTFYRMLPEMGPPETTIWEYPMPDTSWNLELAAFVEDIRLRRTPSPGLADAQAALRVVERVYEASNR